MFEGEAAAAATAADGSGVDMIRRAGQVSSMSRFSLSVLVVSGQRKTRRDQWSRVDAR